MMSTTIVVPCFNEASRLPAKTYLEFLDTGVDIRFLFVDDGSVDDTYGVLQQLCEDSSGRCDLLRLSHNQGKAEAVRQGMLQALGTDDSLVGFWDADLAIPLPAISGLAQIFEERPKTLMVFGSRVRMLGRDVDRDPFRHYAGRLFATVVSLLLSAAVYDTQCGAKLFRVSPRLRWVFERSFLTRWLFDVEILARMQLLGSVEPRFLPEQAVYEFPLHRWDDVAGSKLRWYDGPRAAAGLLRVWWHYRVCAKRRTRP